MFAKASCLGGWQELASGASVRENKEVRYAEHTFFRGVVDSRSQSLCVGIPVGDGAAVHSEGSRAETIPV